MGPGWPMLVQQFMAYRVGVWPPHQLAFSPQEVEILLSPLGFHSVKTYNETIDLIYASTEDWWSFLLTMPVPRATILSMNEETRARFKDEYLANVLALFRRDGLHAPLAVIYTIAER